MSSWKKASIAVTFSLRMFLVLPVAFRLIFIRNLSTSSSDVVFDSVNLIVATQIALHYSIAATTLPCMRSLLRAFDTGLGATTDVSPHAGSSYQQGSKGSSFAMRSLKTKSFNNEPAWHVKATPASILRPEVVHPGRSESVSTHSASSKKAIINRTTQWEMSYEKTGSASQEG